MSPYGPAYRPQMGGLKKVFRKIAGPVAAGAAVAAGQPELAVAAYNTANSVTKKKAKAPALVEPPTPPVSAGLFSNLAPADRNVLLIGGALVATLMLFGGGRRR